MTNVQLFFIFGIGFLTLSCQGTVQVLGQPSFRMAIKQVFLGERG
ncbi:hypothetical protein ABHN11_06200 [Brevibacillus centrosporus]